MKFFYVYVLACSKDQKQTMYIGYCKNLKLRLRRHRNKEIKSTKRFGKIELIYFEGCGSNQDARKRELQLKSGFGRGYIKRRVESYLKQAGVVQW